jgi:co-chaperonin GroES (HSP10)
MAAYEAKHVKIRAIKDHVIVSEMNFDEMKTAGGIVLRSDNAKAHGVKPRWGKVYCVGPDQQDVKVGQWILVEHGRWTRAMDINDGNGKITIHRIDTNGMLAVSDEAPTAEDLIVGDTI